MVHPVIEAAYKRDEALTNEDWHNASIRKELSAPAFRVFLNLAKEWGLKAEQGCLLLGGVADSTYAKWKGGDIGTFTFDQMERLSLIFGIYKALALIFTDGMDALLWLKAKNREMVFGGKAPLEFMLLGNMDCLYKTRRYLDAWRGLD